jgi:hypothetical protein
MSMVERVEWEMIDAWAITVERIEYEEDIIPAYTEALTVAYNLGAYSWALDLAEKGMKPLILREMGRRWLEVEMEPPSYAVVLERLADKIERQ